MKTNDNANSDFLDHTVVAIPVYNEEKYLDIVIDRVKEFANNILIIDDGSTDKTPELLKSHRDISIIRHETNTGYGRSLIDALEHAKVNEFDWIITMDCDLQHEPETLPLFYKYIKENQYDIISGSRYMRPVDRYGICPPKSRAVINQKITNLLKQAVGLELTDSFCGFKAYRVDFFNRMNLTINGYAFPLQVWVQVAKLAGRLTEIPVKMIYSDTMRSFGESLDDPNNRLTYYMNTLNKELNNNGYKRIKEVESTFREGCDIHITRDKWSAPRKLYHF